MNTTERNDPCPCGSGKKYKKCCGKFGVLPPGPMAVLADPTPDQDLEPYAVTGTQAPYGLAKMIEHPELAELPLSQKTLAALKHRWTISKVARMDTDEIVRRLGQYGIDARREAFLPLTEGKTSAWRVGNQWSFGLPQRVPMGEDDFIHLAACELWKRYCPENPSLEMVDDWVSDGYRFARERQMAGQVESWARVWENVRSRWKPNMTTLKSVDPVFNISQFFQNWVQDYAMVLLELSFKDVRLAETGVRFCEEILAQFVDEDKLTRVGFRCDRGSFLFHAKKPEEGEAALREVIRDHPRLPNGYVTLSDELAGPGGGKPGLERAIEVLEEAFAAPVLNPEDWSLKDRLEALRNRVRDSP